MANGIEPSYQKRLEQFIKVPYNQFNNLSRDIKFLEQIAANNTEAFNLVIQGR
jgi:hypothetical protein